MVSVWPTSPRITSWWATRPGRRTEWIGTGTVRAAAAPSAPRSGRRFRSGCRACASWWSSMISAARMCRAASAANRIIRTAPMAKLGATNTLAAPPRAPRAQRGQTRSSRSPRARPAATASRALASAVSGTVKSTSTSGRCASACASEAAQRRVGARHQLEVGRASTRRRRPSPPSARPPRPPRRGSPARPLPRAPARQPLSACSKRSWSGPIPAAESRSGAHSSSVSSARSWMRDGVDPRHHLVDRHQRRAGQHLRAEAVHPGAGRLQRQHDAALEVLLGAGQLLGGGGLLAKARRARCRRPTAPRPGCRRRVPTYRPTWPVSW